MKRVAVIGAGTMGNGIAHVFAQHNASVTLIDVRQDALDKGIATIRGNLDRQVKKGTIAAEAPAQILGRITPASALDAAAGAELVEAATENPDLKFSIFETLDRVSGPRGDPGQQHQLDHSSPRSRPRPAGPTR